MMLWFRALIFLPPISFEWLNFLFFHKKSQSKTIEIHHLIAPATNRDPLTLQLEHDETTKVR